MNTYRLEFYTLNPLTRESGYDISIVYTLANSVKEAKKYIREQFPLFDAFILVDVIPKGVIDVDEIVRNGFILQG